MTTVPCRAGPACPAAGMRFPTAGRCGHRPPTKGQADLPYNERRGRRPAVERSGTNALGVRRPVSAAVPRWEAPSGRGCRRSRLGERKPCGISPSASASRCHLPRRGRQGGSVSPCAAGHMGPALRPPIFATGWVHRQNEIRKAARMGCFSYFSLWDQ